MAAPTKPSRQQEILQTLAKMLENNPGERITTAALAKQVGVSEAALYRHFASKAKMFEALIEFAEETIFSRITLIMQDQNSALARCEQILTLTIAFADRNPGLCRVLTGDALLGENERLRKRSSQIFDRMETQLKQALRQAEVEEGLVTRQPVAAVASLMLACVEGRINQYIRSGFKISPNTHWQDQWAFLSQQLFSTEKFTA
ncbi:MAG: nucleoid occlusion factor SlmA [Pseudomonadales bacterium]